MSRKPNKTVPPIIPADPEEDDPDQPAKPAPPPPPKKPRFSRRAIIIGAVVLLFICGGIGSVFFDTSPDPEPASEVAGQPAATDEPAEEAAEAEEPEPTKPPAPTDTPEPTNTPAPTATLRPTNTPEPTPTSTPAPEPIVLTGSGDDIVDIEKWAGPALARITGNTAGRHFAVINYDADGNQIDLLVNTTDAYTGLRPLDFTGDQHTTRLEVTATGDWQVEILPLESMAIIDVPGSAAGTGDDVIALRAEADTATITGNAGGRHFAVIGYGGFFPDLMVNTTDPYDGHEVIVGQGSRILVITATGDWTIDFTAR